MTNTMEEPISSVCRECGIAANVLTCLQKYGQRPDQLAFTVSTVHKGTCDVCGEERHVTEPRDFFYPNFGLLVAIKNAFDQNSHDGFFIDFKDTTS